MRILYIDIDSQRPDHLGCCSYHRQHLAQYPPDCIAADGVRFDNYYVSDAPCLPSRTALWSGRFGIHNGVINHGGVAAEPFIEGPNPRLPLDPRQHKLDAAPARDRGIKTVTPFPLSANAIPRGTGTPTSAKSTTPAKAASNAPTKSRRSRLTGSSAMARKTTGSST